MTSGAEQVATRLEAVELRLAYGDRTVVEHLDLAVVEHQITVVVGPNACGKSTLVRAMARLLAPARGAVLLDGESIRRLPTREVARRLGMLPQSPIAPDGITVVDLVARGRHPHQRWYRTWTPENEEMVTRALLATDTVDLADRPIDELSGGQRQRVWLAMAIAQDTPILLLDEPTTFLDLGHQLEVLDLLTDLNRSDGRTLVLVLHDLNLAARYADRLIAMSDGAVVANGTPHEVLTSRLVEELFGIRATVIEDPSTGAPLVIPSGRHHMRPDGAPTDPPPLHHPGGPR